eukprot:6180575-Pleurochrysis_carterae.AAC.1
MTRHSAVCVWMPLETSTTSTIMSMICAPPMIVRISEAWPGQSTSVIWSRSYGSERKCSGSCVVNEEKPRSSVIPRSLLCGFLSNAAVEAEVLRARERLRSAKTHPDPVRPRDLMMMLGRLKGKKFAV